MAAAEWHRVAAAARLRRTRPGTFQRSPRTFSPTFRREQYSGLQSHDIRAVLSSAPPANETRLHQAARDHDTEEFAARRIRFVAGGRIHQREVRRNSRFTRS